MLVNQAEWAEQPGPLCAVCGAFSPPDKLCLHRSAYYFCIFSIVDVFILTFSSLIPSRQDVILLILRPIIH